MSQPIWKAVETVGDVNPIEHGGGFILSDQSQVYPPELELIEPSESCSDEGWTVSRIVCERCSFENGILSDNKFHKDHPAWFAGSIETICNCLDCDEDDLIESLCSDNEIARARAYKTLINYFGAFEFDQYPLKFTDRAEIEARYAAERYQVAQNQV